MTLTRSASTHGAGVERGRPVGFVVGLKGGRAQLKLLNIRWRVNCTVVGQLEPSQSYDTRDIRFLVSGQSIPASLVKPRQDGQSN
jgi:hypothetical protein